LTRYLRKGRIAGLAGLASVAVFAFAAAPAGATVTSVCTGTPPYQTCHNVTTVKLSVKVQVITASTGVTVKITVIVTDPFVTIKLYRNGKLVKTVFKGNYSGKKNFKIHPKTPGKYSIKVTAKANGVTKTVVKKFKVA
jgi:hypothetical protein